MIEEKLIGKKIIKAEIKGIEDCDDKPYLYLTMDDGTVFNIIAEYDNYTGKSNDEYPRFIIIKEVKQ